MRDKLIELGREANKHLRDICRAEKSCKYCRYEKDSDCLIASIADHLIANGVTIATENPTSSNKESNKWIPVSERLPDTMDDVLCWYEYFRFGEYQRMFQTHGVGFCVSGMWGGEVANGYKARVLYWMPLPEPPREEV